MKIWELIPINEDAEYTYFVTNNTRFKGTIKIANDKVANFRMAVKDGRIDEDKWGARLC